MITVRPPLAGEIEAIGKSAAEKWVRDSFNSGADFSALINRPMTQVVLADGVPVAAGGFVDLGAGRAVGWALVGQIPRNQFVGVCRTFRRENELSPFHTIEAHCFEEFTQSHRWVRCIGYVALCEPPCFAPDGRRFRRFIFRNDHGN